jgi:tripeptide aminopeptidase
MSDLRADLESRLLRYCAVDTQSDPESTASPSTATQLDLAHMLVSELRAIGLTDLRLADYGTVLATLPGTAPGPTIGLLAHMDTAPQFHASGVKPRVIRGYNGGAITFPDAPGLVLTPEESPYLADRTGDDIVTASGTTLLGADDKAGVAILMALAAKLAGDPGPRPTVRLAFTPDEEIGRGVDARLPADLGCDFAYTLDGGRRGEIEYESFSADRATVTFTGVSIHPGYARGKLVNALTLAARFLSLLPHEMTPETTEGRQGYIHATDLAGSAAECRMHLILRDFDDTALAAKGAMLQAIAAALTATEPRARIEVAITPQYRNMRQALERDRRALDLALAAARAVGLDPVSVPIRGGTDGSRLTELGVPCPNLFTGMQEIHGPKEWISLQDMEVAAGMVDRLLTLATQA